MFHLLNQGRTVCDDVYYTPFCIVYTRWKQNMTAFFVIRLYTKKMACSRDTLQMTADISSSTSLNDLQALLLAFLHNFVQNWL